MNLCDTILETLLRSCHHMINKINCDFHSKEFDNLVDLAYQATINDATDTDISKDELRESFVELQHHNTPWKDFNIFYSLM